MKLLKIALISWGVLFAFSATAANKGSDTTKEQAQHRDAASGLPTGKRQHKPLKPSVTSPRDAASGLPTGKRQHKPINSSVVSPRDAVSGLATGKRQHKSANASVDNDCVGVQSKACKAKISKKGYDHYKASSANKASKQKKNGNDLVLRKRPGRSADKGGDGKKDKKKPLKHEK